MTTQFHWKIILAFAGTTILSLGLFGFIYTLAWKSTEPVPTGVFAFMSLFGVLGMGLLWTMLLRAKRIRVAKEALQLTRCFTFRSFTYVPQDILSYSLVLRQENPWFDYEILQFKTIDHQTHSIVSYEFKSFEPMVDWIVGTGAKKEDFSLQAFLWEEQGWSFLIGLCTTAASMVPLLCR